MTKRRRKNPSWGSIIAVAAGSVFLALTGVMFFRRTRAGDELPEDGEDDEPTKSDGTDLAIYESRYGKAVAYRTNAGQYRVRIHFKSDPVQTEDRALHSDQSARDYALSKVAWFGQPQSPDDIFVNLVGTIDSEYRGSIWQSVENGWFYYDAEGPFYGDWSSGYNSSDSATDALVEKLSELKS